MKVLFLFIQLGIISSHLAFAENSNPNQEWTITQHGPVLLMSNENRGGSAFLIKDNQHTLVVSNVHVVAGLMKGRDTLPPNIQMIGLDLLHDLVVLKIKGRFEDSEVLTLADSPLEANSQLTAIGFPEKKLSRIQGQLLPYDYHSNRKYIMTDYYDPLNGSSGSPVLNSKNQVIGILHAGYDNLVIFISVDSLKNILSQAPLTCEWKECLNNELKRLHQLAETDPLAQYQLGQLYIDGRDVSQNSRKAKMLWWAAAEQGFVPAMYDLSVEMKLRRSIISKIFENLSKIFPAIGMPEDLTKEFELMLVAADQEFAPAMYHAESPIHSTKEFELTLAAAKQGYFPAMLVAIKMFRYGIGVPIDHKQADQWLQSTYKKKRLNQEQVRQWLQNIGEKEVSKETSDSKNPCADSF